ncbi:hypothetical protein M951_chr3145 (nucleomorph) [Lotharella oceanica]|uniref:DNA-directed RNA polymerase RBP11-like dimerisation domain-containing protein n=1 Tax=Lotharella oceanica TaxID=641309 RepID=A0A060DGU5_9EUKA|nr:hypothetical protein M951_chr3145 [Lotharella oceanica]|mmetsp:Transcript_27704/g.51655  ORF Transcript_27704/g.51655 Transcript_27704/m.51655 type:complete len:87 (+) Transcript_27704:1005-1265(+)
MYFTHKILIEGENYTLGNLIIFFFKKNYFVKYSNYEVLHPLREVLLLYITIKKDSKIHIILRDCLKVIKIFLKLLIKIIMKNTDIK